MMKKVWILLLAVLMLTAVACGDGNTAQTGGDETLGNGTDGPSAAEGYICRMEDGKTVQLGAKASDAIAALGEHTDYMEAPSCVHEGFDKVYTYAGAYTVTTSPDANGNEYVAEVSLISDAVGLTVGSAVLYIGSTEVELTSAFGAPMENNFGVQKYAVAGANITAVVDGGVITALTLTYPAA